MRSIFEGKFQKIGVITIEVKIPKEVRAYKETIFFGLSCRQFICSLFAVGIAAGVFMLFDRFMNRETASWLCIVLASPVAIAGFFSYNGMCFEQFLWAFLKSELRCAGERRYISENIYYSCLNRKGCADFD